MQRTYKRIITLAVLIILLIKMFLYLSYEDRVMEYGKYNLPNLHEVEASNDKTQNKTTEPYYKGETIVNIAVNRPVELSYKTKAEVYELRKKYVSDSIFKNQAYEPSEAVFGQIVDNKPWISTNVCTKENGELSTDGTSEESRFLNNPSILVGLEMPFTFSNYTNSDFCTTDSTNIIPKSVTYNPKEKLITVEYGLLPFETTDWSFYQFNGINARDFGYKYVYLDRANSTYDVVMSNESNISSDVYEFNNFIHLGGSCKVDGGCNNGSPRQEFLEFKHQNHGSESGKYIYLKLWKNKPFSSSDNADIAQKIIFSE